MSHSPIYQRIYDARQKYTLPEPWSAIPAPTDCFTLPAKSSQLLAQLESEFGADQLRAAGVAIPSKSSAAKIVWNPVLLDPQSPIWAARIDPAGPFLALVANGQSIDGQCNALDLAIRECPDGYLISPHTRLVVANTMPEFAILRGLGIATIPGPRHFELDGKQLESLLQVLRIGRGSDASAGQVQRPPVQLTFCDWNLCGLALVSQPSVNETWSGIRHRYAFASVTGFGEFRLWKPPAPFVPRLRILILQRDTSNLRKELELNSFQSSVTVKDAVMRNSDEQATLRTVFEKLDLACRPPQDRTRGYGQHEALQSLVEAARISPLIDLAEKTSDPLERGMLLNLIGILRAEQPIIDLMTISIRQQLSDHTKRIVIESTAELRQEMLDMASDVTRRLQEINRCMSSILSHQTARRKNKSKQRAKVQKKEQASSGASASPLRRWPA